MPNLDYVIHMTLIMNANLSNCMRQYFSKLNILDNKKIAIVGGSLDGNSYIYQIICALAAMRAGAQQVICIMPQKVAEKAQQVTLDVNIKQLKSEYYVCSDDVSTILDLSADVLVIGPSIGYDYDLVRDAIMRLASRNKAVTIIDSHALLAIHKHIAQINDAVLTPNANESRQIELVVNDLASLSKKNNFLIMQRGEHDVIIDAGIKHTITTTKDPKIKIKGAGDISVGILAALLAYEMPRAEAGIL